MIKDYRLEDIKFKMQHRIQPLKERNVIEHNPDKLLLDCRDICDLLGIGRNYAIRIIGEIKKLVDIGYYPIYGYRETKTDTRVTNKYVGKYVLYHYFIFEDLIKNKWIDIKDIPPYNATEIHYMLCGDNIKFVSLVSETL